MFRKITFSLPCFFSCSEKNLNLQLYRDTTIFKLLGWLPFLMVFGGVNCNQGEITVKRDGGAAGDGNISSDANISSVPQCPGQESTISGVVYAPNGKDPVPLATVFIPDRTPDPIPSTVQCEPCGESDRTFHLWHARSQFNGKFTIDGVCPGQYSLVIQNGRFRRLISIDVAAHTTLALPEDKTRLPQRNGEFDPNDSIPKIAVATGDYDKMECLLHLMGLAEGVFDFYEGATDLKATPALPSFATLVNDLDKMKSYSIIFINCTKDTFEAELNNSQVRQNITQYLQAGGRLYVTDWSYDWIEQIESLAPFIDFEPGPSGDTPEEPNAAQRGLGPESVSITGVSKDSELTQWMGVVSEAVPNGEFKLEHFLVDWAMIYSVNTQVKTWVEAQISPINDSNGNNTVTRPLMVSFNVNSCGKVLYTSYHTEGRDDEILANKVKPFPQYCSAEFTPQDRILEYLIFDIANCIVPVE